jgi:hypothetical protein
MFMTTRGLAFALALTLFLTATHPTRADLAGFADTGAISGLNKFNNDTAPGFTSGGQFFNNTFAIDPQFGPFWSGWTVSSMTDTTTPGFGNQYSAITGSGHGDGFYGVAFASSPGDAIINITAQPMSIDYTNTTYAYLSMKNGDSFAKKFTTGDFFTFHIDGYTGINGTGIDIGHVVGTLASYTSPTDSPLSQWATLNLSSLAGARSLSLSFQSSDVGNFGINTPTYAVFDNLLVASVPEPSPLWLAIVGLLVVIPVALVKRRRPRAAAG